MQHAYAADNLPDWEKVAEVIPPALYKSLMRELGVEVGHKFDRLGGGSRGTAWKLPRGNVVKLTTDSSEAEAANKIKQKNLKTLYYVEDVYRFEFRKGFLYVITQELLGPGDRDYKNWGELATFYFHEILSQTHFNKSVVPQFRDWCGRRLGGGAAASVVEAADVPQQQTQPNLRRPSQQREKPRETNEHMFPEKDPMRDFGAWVDKGVKPPTEEFYGWFTQLCLELEQNQIEFYDLNAGNMMKRGNEHVVTDLGVSITKNPGQIRDIVATFMEALAARMATADSFQDDKKKTLPKADLNVPPYDRKHVNDGTWLVCWLLEGTVKFSAPCKSFGAALRMTRQHKRAPTWVVHGLEKNLDALKLCLSFSSQSWLTSSVVDREISSYGVVSTEASFNLPQRSHWVNPRPKPSGDS